VYPTKTKGKYTVKLRTQTAPTSVPVKIQTADADDRVTEDQLLKKLYDRLSENVKAEIPAPPEPVPEPKYPDPPSYIYNRRKLTL
jgi:hypothetical protein